MTLPTLGVYRERRETVHAVRFDSNNDDGTNIAVILHWANSEAPKHQHLWSARPLVRPDTSGIRLVRDDAAGLGSIIAREKRSIRAASEAGRRAWS